MHPIGCKIGRLIQEYPVCVISVAVIMTVVKLGIILLVFVALKKDFIRTLFKLTSVYCMLLNTEFWSLSSD